jgi:hypothetical protein
MKVNDISFLTMISKNLMYWTAQYVQCPLASIYCKCLQQVLQIFTLGAFCITMICCDNEFHPLMDPLALKFRLQVNYASLQEHILEAKCNNWVIKEPVHMTLPPPTIQ